MVGEEQGPQGGNAGNSCEGKFPNSKRFPEINVVVAALASN